MIKVTRPSSSRLFGRTLYEYVYEKKNQWCFFLEKIIEFTLKTWYGILASTV